MTIAPIVRSVRVAVPPARAFDLFSAHMAKWWSPDHHIGATPFAEIVIEPRAGGRWYERDADGAETDWGVVLAWEPPHRLLLGWKLDAGFRFDADLVTEVELGFVAEGSGTEVTLTHRNLERFGDSAERTRASLDGGWPTLLALYASLVEQEKLQ